MKTSSVFKIQSVVAMALVSLAIAASAATTTPIAKASEAAPAAAPTVATSDPTKEKQYDRYQELGCEADPSVRGCAALANALNMVVPSIGDQCSALSTRADDFQTKVSDSKTKILEAQQEQAKAIKGDRHVREDAQLKQAQAADQFALATQKINSELLTQEDQARGSLRAAIAKVRKEIDAEVEAVLGANAALRAAEQAVQDAITGQEVACRTAAESAGTKKEAALDGKVASDTTTGAKYNFAQTSLAGSSNRRIAKRRADIQVAYMEAYKLCMGGVTGAGAGANGAITTAQQHLGTAKKTYDETLAVIEQRKKRSNEDLVNMDKDSADQLAAIRRAADSNLAAATLVYKTAMDTTNLIMKQSQEDLVDDMKSSNATLANLSATSAGLSKTYDVALAKLQACDGDKPVDEDAPIVNPAHEKKPTSPPPRSSP